MIKYLIIIGFTLFVVIIGFMAYEVCFGSGIMTGGYLPFIYFSIAPIFGVAVGAWLANE